MDDESLTEEELNFLIGMDELEVDPSDIDEPTEEELEKINNLVGDDKNG